MKDYAEFIRRKSEQSKGVGFKPKFLPDCMKDFQKAIAEWAILRGRGAIYADCGLGKTLMELVQAENVVRKTNKPALILTPLAVASQFVREGKKFEVECQRVTDGKFGPGINVTNYQQLHKYLPSDFSFVCGDESGCIKDFKSKTREAVTEFFRQVPYRLLATATPAPNDWIELGTSSEAIGELGWRDMITKFFKKDQQTFKYHWNAPRDKYRLKGWAEIPFWKWVASWAKACRKPSDLGFPDDGYVLPELEEREHVVVVERLKKGFFRKPAANMREESAERRQTIAERCEKAAGLVAGTKRPAVVWCHLNAEGDLLERLIPDARQVAGSDSDEKKEEAYDAFASGQLRVLVTKPKIGAWGLNWQHCSHVVTFVSHSYEQRYQAIRRCWRFGQERKVIADTIATEGERRASLNLAKKADAADKMFTALVENVADASSAAANLECHKEKVPSWLSNGRS